MTSFLFMPDVLASVIEQAKGGDIQAAKILIDKSLPALRSVDVARPLPVGGDTLTAKASSVIGATASGAISVDEATRLIQALGSMARILEVDDLTKRVDTLEAKNGKA